MSTTAPTSRVVTIDGFISRHPQEFDDLPTFVRFLRDYPAYLSTGSLSRRRESDFARFDANGHVYLDYTGGGQYGLPQLDYMRNRLNTGIFGNPHTQSPASRPSEEYMEEARRAVLAFFNASAADYDVIFTANATAAIGIVRDNFPFGPGRSLCQLLDNHNSVNGMRETAKRAGAATHVAMLKFDDLRLDAADLTAKLGSAHPGLLAYPAQSNFTGVKHDLGWIAAAQAKGWRVLLDAAAFVPTNRLNLTVHRPDYVCVSFYKMFGWPDRIGCLIARKDALAELTRHHYTGGTIVYVTVQGDRYRLAEGPARFEDGTGAYLSLPDVTFGLSYLRQVGIDQITTRVACLTGWTLEQLTGLRHANGRPVVAVYGPTDLEQRGGTIAFNFLTPEGQVIDERLVEQATQRHILSLRMGCFCNPGAGEAAFRVDPILLDHLDETGLQAGATLDDLLKFLGIPTGGAIRASFGPVSTFRDAQRLMVLAAEFRDGQIEERQLPPREQC